MYVSSITKILWFGNISVWYVNSVVYTDGCVKQYKCDLAINLITGLSYSSVIIMHREINATNQGNIVVYGNNATEKRYLKEETIYICNSVSNNTSNIGMIPSASKVISLQIADQCIHIINNKEGLNVLKGSINMKKKESLFKYQ